MTEFFIKAVTITIGAAVLFGTPNVEKNLPIGYEEVYAAVGDTFEFEGIKYEVIDENNCGVISKNYTGEISIPEKAIFDDREYNVTSIGDFAFDYCRELTSVTIPSSVTNIEYTAFFSCYDLNEIIVDENNNNYKSIDNILFSKDESEIIYYPMSREGTSYSIPSSVTSIEKDAFGKCSCCAKYG